MIGYIFHFFYSLFVNVEQFEKKTKGMAFATFISAFINILLNAIFIPRFGYIVAAYTTLISFAIMLLAHFCLVKKMNLHKCYNNIYIFISCVVLVILIPIFIILYDLTLLRYATILIYLIILFVFVLLNKKTILKVFIRKRKENNE